MKSISIDSQIRFGAPHVRGTRISVADILGYLAGGDSVETILENFPELTRKSVLGAISYASDMFDVSAQASSSHETIAG